MSETYTLFSVFGESNPDDGEIHAVILDSYAKYDQRTRQSLATKLGFNETIFINNADTGSIDIFDTTHQLPFAGTAALATAKFISELNPDITSLSSMECEILTYQENGLFWVEASEGSLPDWNIIEMAHSSDVEVTSKESAQQYAHTFAWSWLDKRKGFVRARTFASDWGIAEVKGNGSGSMQLALSLNQRIEVAHGSGARIIAEPSEGKPGYAKLGGKVVVLDKLAIPPIP